MIKYDDEAVADSSEGWKCKICNMKFLNKESLGGHTSKAHPNSSNKYKKKLQTRMEREPERILLATAKSIFYKAWPGKDINFNRQRLSTIKRQLKKQIGEVDKHSPEFESALELASPIVMESELAR